MEQRAWRECSDRRASASRIRSRALGHRPQLPEWNCWINQMWAVPVLPSAWCKVMLGRYLGYDAALGGGRVRVGVAADGERELQGYGGRVREVAAECGLQFRLRRTPDETMPATGLVREASFSSGGFTKLMDRLIEAVWWNAGTARQIAAPCTPHSLHADVSSPDRALEVHIASLRRHVLGVIGENPLRSVADAMRQVRSATRDGVAAPTARHGSGNCNRHWKPFVESVDGSNGRVG